MLNQNDPSFYHEASFNIHKCPAVCVLCVCVAAHICGVFTRLFSRMLSSSVPESVCSNEARLGCRSAATAPLLLGFMQV